MRKSMEASGGLAKLTMNQSSLVILLAFVIERFAHYRWNFTIFGALPAGVGEQASSQPMLAANSYSALRC